MIPGTIRTILFILIWTVAFACSDNKINLTYDEVESSELDTSREHPNTSDLSSIELGQDIFSIGDLSSNLYGKFYNERVSFYIFDDAQVNLSGHDYAATMILYFIDDILYKKKFIVHETIFIDFLNQYNIDNNANIKHHEGDLMELDEMRFFSLKIKRKDREIKLRKSDFNEYAIEEYHQFFSQALISAKG